MIADDLNLTQLSAISPELVSDIVGYQAAVVNFDHALALLAMLVFMHYVSKLSK